MVENYHKTKEPVLVSQIPGQGRVTNRTGPGKFSKRTGFLFFDKRDHEMIRIVNSVYDARTIPGYATRLYYPFFHPLGIKELAESRGLRTAYAIVNLLASMEREEIDNRLRALQGLKEDIFSVADGPMPMNTARVLLQIMKELVRARGAYARQLQLAHDFRMAAFGKPRVVRQFLDRYHLLEMPEEWNQMTFDDHVHDANTSGRKTPTHLIMDAWIKGIRRLRVIYYHYIEPKFAAELIEAARIMEIDLRIGIEFRAKFQDRYISFVWVSRGFTDVQAFLCFLSQPHVADFMEKGKEVVHFQEKCVLELLEEFNAFHLDRLCKDLDLILAPPHAREFLDFARPGQASALYLAEYLHTRVQKAASDWINTMDRESESDAGKIERKKAKIQGLGVRDILSGYLCPSHESDPFSFFIEDHQPEIPDRLKLDFSQLLKDIHSLHHEFRITLNLNGLRPEDVLELLYDSEGAITRIEILNLKNFTDLNSQNDIQQDIIAVNQLQKSINEGSLLKLKQGVRKIIQNAGSCGRNNGGRMKKLMEILHDIDGLRYMYSVTPLKSRIGSDSTGKPHRAFGMGFGVVDTLAPRALAKIRQGKESRLVLPITAQVCRRITSRPLKGRILRHLPCFHSRLFKAKQEWMFDSFSLNMGGKGNIVTLGKMFTGGENGFNVSREAGTRAVKEKSWQNLNTKVKNILKCVVGFIPAFCCFFLTKEWWLLACFGAFIWFGITGVRNILQSLLGGVGLKRSSLMKWNDHISWDRLSDSLLFTGFSVPLLDYFVKTLLLDRGLGIDMKSSPLVLYSVMALANGIYLFSHNTFRGLPKGAGTWNFFRSILSIPIALVFNMFIGFTLAFFNIPGIDGILQKWAAIISKAASDTMAGLIEGLADRFHNMRLRERDIQQKFSDLFETYSRLALLFPETEELKILEKPDALFNNRNSEVRDLTVMIVINCLDLLYFFMFLPRARLVMEEMVSRLTPEEKHIFFLSQKLLSREQQISRLFVDGILGRNFSRPLSFYLTSHEDYFRKLAGARYLTPLSVH